MLIVKVKLFLAFVEIVHSQFIRSTVMEPKERIIVPLDVSSVGEARRLVDLLADHVGCFKIGLEFIWSMIANLLISEEEEAVSLLSELRSLARAIGGQRAFIDAKLADIPNTIKKASIAISRLGVRFFNVHASAGPVAIAKAVASKRNSLVLGVTVLTSLSQDDCQSIFGDVPGEKVLDFTAILADSGADGIICSPQELKLLGTKMEYDNLLKVTPGVRPHWASVNDQKRVMTPAEAIEAGADYLVIGRPIINPPTEIGGPVEAAERIADEIASAS